MHLSRVGIRSQQSDDRKTVDSPVKKPDNASKRGIKLVHNYLFAAIIKFSVQILFARFSGRFTDLTTY